jgi:hypothetical protein
MVIADCCLTKSFEMDLERHCLQTQRFTVSGDVQAVALLNQIKNQSYSQLEGREELFERV